MARIYGRTPSWVRAGIVCGWLPIGKATRKGQLVTSIEEIAINNGTVNENDEKFIFYEEQHDSFFEMSMADFYYAVYHFNRNFTIRGYATLNEFYEFLGIDTLPSGDVLGWSIDSFYDATSKKANDYAVLKTGTRVTVQELKTLGSDIWAKIPSGYICLRYNGNSYAK